MSEPKIYIYTPKAPQYEVVHVSPGADLPMTGISGLVVSDAMVERALEGYDNAFQSPGGSHEVAMRAALAAALGVEG